jgi:hypothetical protein
VGVDQRTPGLAGLPDAATVVCPERQVARCQGCGVRGADRLTLLFL